MNYNKNPFQESFKDFKVTIEQIEYSFTLIALWDDEFRGRTLQSIVYPAPIDFKGAQMLIVQYVFPPENGKSYRIHPDSDVKDESIVKVFYEGIVEQIRAKEGW